jgi:hypothetical protein
MNSTLKVQKFSGKNYMEETSDRIGTNWGSRIDWFLWECKIGFMGI